MTRKRPLLLPEMGFTLIELLVVLAISGIIAKIIISVFIDQQKSYKAQIGISALQQNVRTAMNMITEDIRMAGYYTFLNNRSYRNYIDWNPVQKGLDEFIPLIHGVDGIKGIKKYRENSDIIFIVKASKDKGVLNAFEGASAGEKILYLGNRDLNGDGNEDLNNSGSKFGVLTKADLSCSEIFKIASEGPPIIADSVFKITYQEGDYIARADMIVYRVDDQNDSFKQAVLERKNFGNGNQFQVVSEDISDLQIKYVLDDGLMVDDPAGEEKNICAVQVELTGALKISGRLKKTLNLKSMIEIRNRGV